jgi:hypothetical protein
VSFAPSRSMRRLAIPVNMSTVVMASRTIALIAPTLFPVKCGISARMTSPKRHRLSRMDTTTCFSLKNARLALPVLLPIRLPLLLPV